MMFRSVRWRLLLNSLLVSLATILVVGVVTAVLVDAAFNRQERRYLQAQAALVAPTLAQAVAADNTVELQRLAALAGFANELRVQVLDSDGFLLADSGARDALTLFDPLAAEAEVIVGAVVDERGNIVSLSPPLSRRGGAGGVFLSLVEPAALFAGPDSFSAISNARLRTPLQRGARTVGYLELSQGPAVGEEARRGIWLALLASSLVALAIAASVGLLSARQVTRPLQELGAAAEAMGAGNLTARAPQSRLAELGRLAQQFNAMADRLARTIGRLETEREGLRGMIADASHELRTPLTALKTFNTLLQEELAVAGAAPEAAATFVRESEKQIKQLDRLTQGMLDLSRLEGRLSGNNFVDADLRSTLENAAEMMRPLCQARAQSLQLKLPPQAVITRHDPAALQQAIANLLHNAVRYTAAGGHLELALEVAPEEIHILISDDGRGIPPDIQERIFDRFYRGPEQPEGDSGRGSGLGLAISREIVAIHQGRLSVSSQPGQGSTFTISFPR